MYAIIAISVITLIVFYYMASNVSKIKKYQKVQMNVLIEMALKNGVEQVKIDDIKTELVGFWGNVS